MPWRYLPPVCPGMVSRKRGYDTVREIFLKNFLPYKKRLMFIKIYSNIKKGSNILFYVGGFRYLFFGWVFFIFFFWGFFIVKKRGGCHF